MSFNKGKMKKLILIICLVGFSTAYALQFQSFNFNDESDCAEQLGQLPVSLPRDIINPNYLSKSKEICLKAYIGDNACRKEYHRQKDALGLVLGISSNYTAKQQAKAQCGTWLKARRSACESFLQKASAVCYQIKCVVEDSDIGDSYSGDCQNGKAHGFGVAKGRDTYRGNFIDGKTHGHGVYTWDSGSRYEGDRYEGNMVNSKITGQGTYYHDNGDRYEGSFVNGKRTGQGTYYYSNGDTKTGYWVNNECQNC